MTRALTDFQVDVLALANSGLSNREIAASLEKPFACIISTLSNIKRRGHKLPDHRPLDATAEEAKRREEGRDKANRKKAPRFTVDGVKKSTGEKIEVTSDSLAFAEAHLAAMLGEYAPLIPNPSQIYIPPGPGGPKGSYAQKTLIDHADVFQMHCAGMTPTDIGVVLGVRRGTISRILRRQQ